MQYFKFTVHITFSKHGYVGVQNSSRIILLLRENGLGFHLRCVLNTSKYCTRIFFFALQHFRDTHTHTHTHTHIINTLPNPHPYMTACLSLLFHHPPAHSSVIPSTQRA